MATTSFWEHPIDRLEEALSIRKQIAALQSKLGSLFGSDAPPSTATRKGGRRRMSPAARARIAAAQRARWAKQKGTTAAVAEIAVLTGSPKRRGKRIMAPEARERIAAAQRARWAKRKGTGSALTAAVQSKPAGKRRGGKRKVSAAARAKMAEAARKRWAKIKKGG
jgi:hypothetical protein